jgi:hypothetical protein
MLQRRRPRCLRLGTAHTKAVVMADRDRGDRFLREVDASVVLVNASTRFNDDFELGLGAVWGFPRRNCMLTGRWASTSSAPASGSATARARSVAEPRHGVFRVDALPA